jgi:hypothetical protein
MLFAQAGGPFNNGGGQNPDIPPEVLVVFAVIMLIAVAIGLIIQIFYLLTLYKCFSRISPRNRRMEPGMVWLNLIPCFNLIWIFFTTTKLADSLRDEFDDRRLHGDGDYGRTLGIVYPILAISGAVPYLGAVLSLASLVCWIIYWVKIAGYSQQLGDNPSSGQDWDDDYDRDRYAEQT